MTSECEEIKICRSTRTILQFSLVWPPDKQELHPSKWYYGRIILLIVTTSVWFFCIIKHLIVTFNSKLDLEISEDVAFAVVFCGLYYMTFIYVKNQKKIAFLLRDLSSFENFGEPPKFKEMETRLSFYSKLLYAYATLGGIVYNLVRMLEKGECEKLTMSTTKEFNQVCGLMSPFWIPIDINDYHFLYYLIFAYILVCSQMLIKISLMMSYNATELAFHIILRINHLKTMIVNCFNDDTFKNRRSNLRRCVIYHKEIMAFSYRLDDCFSFGMFMHITMTSAIFACIEKQFVDGEHQLCAAIHFGGWILTLFVACFGGQHLISASESLPRAIWSSKWYRLEANLQRDLILMMLRSQSALKITAGPFGVMSYTSFVSVLKMSYSILCMLTKGSV